MTHESESLDRGSVPVGYYAADRDSVAATIIPRPAAEAADSPALPGSEPASCDWQRLVTQARARAAGPGVGRRMMARTVTAASEVTVMSVPVSESRSRASLPVSLSDWATAT